VGYPTLVPRSRLSALSLLLVSSWLSVATAANAQNATPPAIRERIDRVGADLFSTAPHAAEAIAELKSILAAEPGSAEAHMLLGLAYRIQGNTELLGEAVAELRQALALNPELNLARLSLARLYLDMARPARARDELTVALERTPGQPQLLAMLGEAERLLGNPKRSIELNQEVLAAQPEFVQARYYLGLALLESGDHAAAIKELQQVVQSGANPAEANLGLGTAYLAAGRTADAIAALRESVRLDPSKPDAHIRLAHAYRARGQLAEAAKELEAAAPSPESIAGLYTDVQTDYHLEEGLIRLAQGRLDAAAAAFEQVLALDANNAAAKAKLAEVNKRRQRPPGKPPVPIQ
jgi:tetratricopeptide (TPR) repeat protein